MFLTLRVCFPLETCFLINDRLVPNIKACSIIYFRGRVDDWKMSSDIPTVVKRSDKIQSYLSEGGIAM